MSHGQQYRANSDVLTSPSAAATGSPQDVSYISAEDAAAIDAALMDANGPTRFTLAQLMELAGLAVAHAVFDFASSVRRSGQQEPTLVTVVCGPGNNGGDGLVAARHLQLFFGGAASVEIAVPKRSGGPQRPYFDALEQQAVACGVTVMDPSNVAAALMARHGSTEAAGRCNLVIDAVFGFSFSGAIRPPFDDIIAAMNALQRGGHTRICSVDIPSGWNVDRGHEQGVGLDEPAMLVSLTLPKKGVRQYAGVHYVGGRVIPLHMQREWRFPRFEGALPVARL